MDRAALLVLLFAVLACSSGKPPDPQAKPADRPACDARITALSDPGQKQVECPNGERFIVRRAADGKWYEEMKVRAGIVPGYATPEEAARARCCRTAGAGS